MNTTNQTRVLVVGLGSIGRRHARLLSERDDVELWLCDLQPPFIDETLATLRHPTARCFGDLAAALAAEPDVAMICTPTSTHAAMAQAALEAGCDLFVEKPICTDSQTAREIADAAERAERLLQVGYMLRFEEGLMRMKSLVDCGSIGEVVGGRAMIGTYNTLLNARDSDRERVPYSLLLDYTHEFDFLHWILGKVQCVSATAASLGRLKLRPCPNTFQALLTMHSGALVQVHLDYVQHPQRRLFEIYGDRGTLLYDFTSGVLQRIPHSTLEQGETVDFGPIGKRVDGLYRRQLDCLLHAHRKRLRPPVGGDEAFAALSVVEAAVESIESGRQVAVESLSVEPRCAAPSESTG